jgi:hypothetical protein
MEWYIIAWLYGWGAIVTIFALSYAGLVENEDPEFGSAVLWGLLWPVFMPVLIIWKTSASVVRMVQTIRQ